MTRRAQRAQRKNLVAFALVVVFVVVVFVVPLWLISFLVCLFTVPSSILDIHRMRNRRLDETSKN